MGERWQMNRIGFVNFWLYDEETFLLADGKLLLRGQNGSGKSITTQSFIPFILDGDRTPSRLDPFGSSDRRMEYYFLGERELDESTGYLFLEFKRGDTEQYRTIGIGQRAQKGKSMGFWGFVLLDGRRIGYDMNLYQSVGSRKIPLTRQELKKELGERNPFTETQKEYMALVNKHIFGFPRPEQYDQFVRLLIKVRAPKLSKEFKPTRVYEILNDSLQQLSDEDLRAMVEAMEKMDDIQSRLDDLKMAFRDVQVLRTIYIRYNSYMLGKKALAYLEEKKKVDGIRGRLDAREEEIREKQEEIQDRQGEAADLTESLGILETEKLALNMEELEASIDKLESFQTDKAEADEEKERLTGRIEDRREKIRSLDVQEKECRDVMEARRQEVKEYLVCLEEANQILRFDRHDSVKTSHEKSSQGGDYREAEAELKELGRKIREGEKALTELDQAIREWDRGEQELQERLVVLGASEEQVKEAEKLEHECRDKLIEGYHICAEKNEELVMTREDLASVVEGIYNYQGARDLGGIRRQLHRLWEQENRKLLELHVQYERSREEGSLRKEQVLKELEDLRHMQEPVPVRKKRVEEARKILKEQKISCLPFYQTVEFTPETGPKDRDRIECQLSDAGILDALVVARGDYERAKRALQGLSDSLICSKPSGNKPYPYLEPGNAGPEIQEVVRGILSNMREEDGQDAEFILAGNGYFKNGVLEGYSSSEEEGSYIGVTARKMKKERMILEKEEELKQAERELFESTERVEAVRERLSRLSKEYEGLPEFDDLDQAIEMVKGAVQVLERSRSLYEEQERLLDQLKQRKREQEQRVITVCRSLPYERKAQAYEEAADALEEYMVSFSELKDVLKDLEVYEEKAGRIQESIEKEEESIDVDYDYLRKAVRTGKELEVQIRHIEDYLNNPETRAKAERLQQLKKDMEDQSAALQNHKEKLAVLRNHVELLTAEIQRLKADTAQQIGRETKLREYFQEELSLGLVAKQGDRPLYEMALEVKECIKEGDRSRSGVEMTTSLMKTFQAHTATLHSYGTSMEECFADDGTDPSILRSRQQIVFIWNGKRLYLEEFYTVIKGEIESNELLIQQKDRELFEGILADTLSRKLSSRIGESRKWIRDMSDLMGAMDTSMGLTFSLEWKPKSAEGEQEMDTKELEKILGRDRELLTTEDIEKVSVHFRAKIRTAKNASEENGDIVNYVDLVRDALDYRKWFEFRMYYYRNRENKKELTNGAFNRFSGGEKAMAMYIPLFAAVNAQYKKSEYPDHPRMIAMDEAFAGVDDKNISSMFELVEKLDFDYIMNSQALWGCYETVKSLRIAELLRPSNARVVTVIFYYWNGHKRVLDEQ